VLFIVKKRKVIKIIEKLLSKVAIDYYLLNDSKSVKTISKTSSISMTSEENELKDIIGTKKYRKIDIKNKNNCPKPRRPINDKCPSSHPFMIINKKGNPCCYKKSPKQPKEPKKPKEEKDIGNKCPTSRRPIDGKCPPSHPYMRNNKHGNVCCFKLP